MFIDILEKPKRAISLHIDKHNIIWYNYNMKPYDLGFTPGINGRGCDPDWYLDMKNGFGGADALSPDDCEYAIDGSDLYIAPIEEQLDRLQVRIAELHTKEAAGTLTLDDIDEYTLTQAEQIVLEEAQRLEELEEDYPSFCQHIDQWVAQEIEAKIKAEPNADVPTLKLDVIDQLMQEIQADYDGDVLSAADKHDLRKLESILQTMHLQVLATLGRDELRRLYRLAA